MLTKQEILSGRAPWGEQLCRAVLAFMVMGLVSGLSLASVSDAVLPGGARLVQPRRMPVRRIPGGGRTCKVSS